jgi:broad specificity phosphatase PhoE
MKFDKIIIESSPFVRCIQTAAKIADGLGVEEVRINYLACEHLYSRDFKEYNPLPELNSVQAGIGINTNKKFRELHNIPDSVNIK